MIDPFITVVVTNPVLALLGTFGCLMGLGAMLSLR